ncbi:MAG: N-acetyltransferase [Gordonia sp. (in: high G+C Gram-positive bacteria)]
MIIRRELPDDVDVIRRVVTRAFADEASADEPVEAVLVDRLRADRGWKSELSLVAVVDRQIAGHVVCTRGYVDGRPALGLAPLSVEPAMQGRGIGSALMHAVLGAADALGEPFVALLGNPDYYGRFGFVLASTLRIVASDAGWGDFFQVRTLTAYDGERGTFAYATPFDGL